MNDEERLPSISQIAEPWLCIAAIDASGCLPSTTQVKLFHMHVHLCVMSSGPGSAPGAARPNKYIYMIYIIWGPRVLVFGIFLLG